PPPPLLRCVTTQWLTRPPPPVIVCPATNPEAPGKLPACVESCPTKALIFGDLNDPQSDVNRVLAEKVYYRDKVHLGTKPKLFKIPHQKGEV
ncbi:hypothetical protein K6U65_10410, partial [Vibrio vulnificus]|nr:hypothetical protein [Vibrio vulnificus]